jgi:hypothetical protein
MEKSESIKNLTLALIQFQSKMEPLELDAEVEVTTDKGGKYKFKYATLKNIIESTRQPLAENGFALMQTVGEGGSVTTLLAHESGEWVQDTVLIAPVKSSPQAIGSSITYAKRYSMTAILRLVSESDEDGNMAEGNTVEVKELPKTQFRSSDERPWLSEKAFNVAIEKLKTEEVITVDDEGILKPADFVAWLTKTYKMKRIYAEQLDIQLKTNQFNGSNKPVKQPAGK